jgi:hypothetical protein
MMRGDISFMKEEQILLLIPPLRIKITNHVGKKVMAVTKTQHQ